MQRDDDATKGRQDQAKDHGRRRLTTEGAGSKQAGQAKASDMLDACVEPAGVAVCRYAVTGNGVGVTSREGVSSEERQGGTRPERGEAPQCAGARRTRQRAQLR